MRRLYFVFLLISLSMALVSCGNVNPLEDKQASGEILVYSAMSVADAVTDLTVMYNQSSECRAKVLYGGSSHLKYAIEANRTGDIFIPGVGVYNDNFLKDKTVTQLEHIGKYTPVLYVRKGNPLRLTGSLSGLADKTVRVGLGSPVSSGIGQVTSDILHQAGLYDEVMDNAAILATDSRQLMLELAEGRVDVVVNWAHSGTGNYFSKDIAPIAIEPEAKSVSITIGILKYTRNKECADKFMELAVSEMGRAVFGKYADIE